MYSLDRLVLAHKFMLIGALAVLMAALPTGLLVRNELAGISEVRRERSGIAPARDALKLIQLTQQQRALSAALLGGNAGSAEALRARRADIAQALDALQHSTAALDAGAVRGAAAQLRDAQAELANAVDARTIDAPQSVARHTALVARQLELLAALAEISGIVLDPAPASYHLGQATLVHLPRLAESLGQARARGALLLARGDASAAERVDIGRATAAAAVHADKLAYAITAALAADTRLRAELEAPAQAAALAAREVLDLADAQFLRDARATLAAPDYIARTTERIDRQFVLIDASFERFAALLDERERAGMRSLLVSLATLALLGAAALWLMSRVARGAIRSMGEAARVARAVAAGDLGTRIAADPAARDESGQLLQALREMNDGLSRVVAQVREGAESVATASAQIAQGNQDLSQRTERQAASLQETSATMSQLGATVRANAENAQQADRLAREASEIARSGGGVIDEVVRTMRDIDAGSRRIVEIIATIDGIAFQTNILALNAAVEAARAGEQGRGFAVVAGEVRTLAQRSAAAARDIKQLIDGSVERVAQGAAQADRAGATMHGIVESVQRVGAIVGEISAASAQQSAGVLQVGQAVAQMDQATQQNAALVEESAAAATSLRQQAGTLVQSVEVFRLAAA